jgi:hypothetical protein
VQKQTEWVPGWIEADPDIVLRLELRDGCAALDRERLRAL